MNTINFKKLPEYDNHNLVTFEIDEELGLFSVIAIHRSNADIPSFGATRFWNYTSNTEGVRDALRLSKLMSYKASLAGLECGGAKGVIVATKPLTDVSEDERVTFISRYAKKVSELNGRFVTGTDVGIRQEDLVLMKNECPYIVGFNENSASLTAFGVFESMKVAVQEVYGSSSLNGKRIAIQGLGKVGSSLLTRLYENVEDLTIFVSDIDPIKMELWKKTYPGIISVDTDDIAIQDVDIYAPCALSGSISQENIPHLKAKIICGGANNQLTDDSDIEALYKRDILYVPDYIANAGGLIAVFDEYKNPIYNAARVETKVGSITRTLEKVFEEAKAHSEAPARSAKIVAESIFNAYTHA